MSADPTNKPTGKRPRGRPRLDIDPNDVADAVAELFAEGGLEAVSILDAAEKLSVSRATLYRTVPTKEHLLGILFERSTSELTENARALLDEHDDPGEQLIALVELQIDAAIRMRRYMPVFFGGGELPPDVFERWHKWSRDYESIWADVIRDNMAAGTLADGDEVITARLLLGACIWVSRWYRPKDKYDAETITETAVNLVRTLQIEPRATTKKTTTKKATRKGAKSPAKTGKRASSKK